MKTSVAQDHMRSFGLTTDTEKFGRMQDWELDRLTAAELGCDEALTVLDRHGVDDNTAPVALGLRMLSRLLHDHLTESEGADARERRLLRMRETLTNALPAR